MMVFLETGSPTSLVARAQNFQDRWNAVLQEHQEAVLQVHREAVLSCRDCRRLVSQLEWRGRSII